MSRLTIVVKVLGACLIGALLVSCTSRNAVNTMYYTGGKYKISPPHTNYASRLPDTYNTNGRKMIVVDPKKHVWGAYDENGELVKAGLATAGGHWCKDTGRACKTSPGKFTIKRLGDEECKSSIYPKPNGGGLMPYCMFFNGGVALHGSPEGAVVEGNISHGCVRVRIPDAEWIRNEFAQLGTHVVVKPY